MQRKLVFAVVTGLVINVSISCEQPEDQTNFNRQANKEAKQVGMGMLLDLAVYRNIVNADKKARETNVTKKAADKFSASFKNLAQTYAKELSGRLSDQEKAVINNLLADVKILANTLKELGAQVNDPSLNQEAKAQLVVTAQYNLVDQIQRLSEKMKPFGIVNEEQKISEDEASAKFDEFFSKVISFIDSITDIIKKGK